MADTVQDGSILDAATWGGTLPPLVGLHSVKHACTAPTGTLTVNYIQIDTDYGGSLSVTGNFVLTGSLAIVNNAAPSGQYVTVVDGAWLSVGGSATAGLGTVSAAGADLILVESGGRLTVGGLTKGGEGGSGEGGGGASAYTGGTTGGNGNNGGVAVTATGAATLELNGGVTGGVGGVGGAGGNGYADETEGSAAPGGTGGNAGNGGVAVLLTATSSGVCDIVGNVTGGNGGPGGGGGSEGNWSDTYVGGGGSGGTGGNGALAILQDADSECEVVVDGLFVNSDNGAAGPAGGGAFGPGAGGAGGTRENSADLAGFNLVPEGGTPAAGGGSVFGSAIIHPVNA